MQTKSVKSVSLPNEIWERLDELSKQWYGEGGNRSAALTRVILEWEKTQSPKKPKASINGSSVNTSKELSTLAA